MPPNRTITIRKPTLLIVEGQDDKTFFEVLLQAMGIADIQVEGIGGKTILETSLPALALSSDFRNLRSLGIVRDADEDANAAFQSVCHALRSSKLPEPPAPRQSVSMSPKISVLILPESNQPGALESLCLASVSDDPAMPCVEAYFDCLPESAKALSVGNRAKAKMQVFLASRDEIELRLGHATQKGYFALDSQAFATAREFLEQIHS